MPSGIRYGEGKCIWTLSVFSLNAKYTDVCFISAASNPLPTGVSAELQWLGKSPSQIISENKCSSEMS